MRTLAPALTFAIQAELFRSFPELRVGALVVSALDRAAVSLTSHEMRTAWISAKVALAHSGITRDNFTTARAIHEWRRAFCKCEVNPSTHPPGIEIAVREALTADRPMAIVPVAELCRTISAGRLAPLVGFDMESLPSAALALRAARPASDWFMPLGARPTDLPLAPGLIVYASGSTVLSWSFNHRASRQTCLRAGTRYAIFFSEAITTAQARAVTDVIEDLRLFLIERGASASAPVFADCAAPEITLPALPVKTSHRMSPTNPRGETRP